MENHTQTEDSEDTRKILIDQTKEYYSKAIVEQKIHEIYSEKLFTLDSIFQWFQITLSAMVAGGFASIFLEFHKDGATKYGGILAFALLLLNTYRKNYNLSADAQLHKHVADALWHIAAKITSLITDISMKEKPLENLQKERDLLIDSLSSALSSAPSIPLKEYQNSLEELKKNVILTDDEIERLFPEFFKKNKMPDPLDEKQK